MKNSIIKFVFFFMRIFFLVSGLCFPALSVSFAVDPPQPVLRDKVLVIDNSGSMKKNDPQFLARDFVRNFIDNQGNNTRFGMVLFDETTRLLEAGVAGPCGQVILSHSIHSRPVAVPFYVDVAANSFDNSQPVNLHVELDRTTSTFDWTTKVIPSPYRCLS